MKTLGRPSQSAEHVGAKKKPARSERDRAGSWRIQPSFGRYFLDFLAGFGGSGGAVGGGGATGFSST
jgi:hypothetical protein